MPGRIRPSRRERGSCELLPWNQRRGIVPALASEYQGALDYLQAKTASGEVWNATVGTVVRYILERESATVLATLDASTSTIHVELGATKTLPPDPGR